jgi:hypothetical protein
VLTTVVVSHRVGWRRLVEALQLRTHAIIRTFQLFPAQYRVAGTAAAQAARVEMLSAEPAAEAGSRLAGPRTHVSTHMRRALTAMVNDPCRNGCPATFYRRCI